ncbi:hemin uptake protein HemP [Piscinibacter gummiphilus]|uniref:Hemin uptake protein HemP n=1 Tax=Piscinibacter gummiphilus TaxID=946333 RepID=A0ABZ0CU86_9BURK|nr:hemin uptake protein HemP [Piscinibacter gummiphilus]WOB08538.1 hemin uptake protein HemP [Piscinibacter gummiphilus]
MNDAPPPIDRPVLHEAQPAERAQQAEPRISSRQLLGDSKEVLIEHRGAIYRLRETSLGKLILTK